MSLDVYLYEPMSCPHCGKDVKSRHELFHANVTHNVNTIAMAAGIYEPVWRPDEIGLTKAGEIAERLVPGISRLKEEPDKYRALNPPNGWGSYDRFVPWLERYLAACREYPDALVEVCR